jgi:glutamine amidotransferase
MITIVDYQMGNLRSVQKAFERAGYSALVTSRPDEIARAEKLVLPGVGAFGDAMVELKRRSLVAPIQEVIGTGRPFLGICLGLQLLFEVGHEDGCHEGLGVIPGEVRRFELGAGYKIPHMGWNQVCACRPVPLLEGIPDGQHFYFVHSYYAMPRSTEVVAAETTYGARFCSMVWRGHLFATQFHPEKSQAVGLRLLRNFARLKSEPSSPSP